MIWKDDAACWGSDPDLFFPEFHGKKQPTKTAQARMICAGCSVAVECLEYANETMQPYGIWGGTTPRERKRIRALSGMSPGRRRAVGQKELAEVEGMTSQEAAELLGVAPSTVRDNRRLIAGARPS